MSHFLGCLRMSLLVFASSFSFASVALADASVPAPQQAFSLDFGKPRVAEHRHFIDSQDQAGTFNARLRAQVARSALQNRTIDTLDSLAA